MPSNLGLARQQPLKDRTRTPLRASLLRTDWALAKTGIVALVDEATGYQEVRPEDALAAYLEKVIRKELAAWVKRFPDEFYENIYKLKGWVWPGMQKNRYSVVARSHGIWYMNVSLQDCSMNWNLSPHQMTKENGTTSYISGSPKMWGTHCWRSIFIR